jgi:hypothetical protein
LPINAVCNGPDQAACGNRLRSKCLKHQNEGFLNAWVASDKVICEQTAAAKYRELTCIVIRQY